MWVTENWHRLPREFMDICQPNPHLREMYCLLGDQVRDIIERLPSLVQPTDYLLLLFHVSASNIVRSSLISIKKVYRAVGTKVRGSREQVSF